MALDLIQIDGFPETSALLNWLVTAGPDGEGKKISLENVKAELGVDALMQFGGAIVPASTPEPTGDFFWVATEEGIYTNFGGVVVPAASMAVISRIDGVFTSSITTIPQPENKIERWEAGTYSQGDQRIHNGQIWSVNVDSTTEEPGIGNDWIGDIDKIGRSDITSFNLIDPSYFLYNAIINSSGNVNTTNRAGAICIVNHPLPVGTFTIGGFAVMTGKNFAIKDIEGNVKPGSNIQLTSLPYTFTTDAVYRYVSFTFKNPTTSEPDNSGWEGTLGMSEGTSLNVGVKAILNQPIIASSLSEGNTVPDPVDPENAINKRHFDTVAIATSDMEFSNSDVNLAWPSRARDGIFIGSGGQKALGAGWRMFRIPVGGMAFITVSGFSISDSGYSSFWDNTEIDGQVGTTGMILNNGGFNTAGLPLTLPVPAGAEYLLIDVKRPANSLSDSELLMINEGQSALPYTPAATVTKIKGYALGAGGGGEAYDQSLNKSDSVEFQEVKTNVLNAMAWIIENATVWDGTGTPPIGAEYIYVFPDGNGDYFVKLKG